MQANTIMLFGTFDFYGVQDHLETCLRHNFNHFLMNSDWPDTLEYILT